MTDNFCDISTLIPHTGPMALLDKIIEEDGPGCISSFTITEDSTFLEEKGVPAWIGIEYMAQAMSVSANYEIYKKKEPLKKGFILGTRKFNSSIDYFEKDKTYISRSTEEYAEGNIASYRCRIYTWPERQKVQEAELTVMEIADNGDNSGKF